jgi:cell division protein FtsW
MESWTKKYLVLKGDRVLWAMIILLMLFSLVIVFSSTGKWAYDMHGGDTIYPLKMQVLYFLAGAVIMLVAQSMHYKYFIALSVFVWLLGMAGLVYAQTLPESAKINETLRSIPVPGLGTIQPAEIAKLGVVMWVARIIAFEQVDRQCGARALLKVALCLCPVAGLIFKENFSTSVLLGVTALAMLFIGRLRGKLMVIVLVTLVAGSFTFYQAIYAFPQLEKIARIKEVKHRLERTDDYQLRQSKIAIASGGLRGIGPGQSVQRDFLPNAFSDCAYSIIVEEYGLVIGGGGILLVYMIILYRVGVIIRRCTRMFPALLVAGLGLMIVFQALTHMLVCVGIFPMTGQQLPFVSMGGTSILATACAFGMIQGVAHTFSDAGRREEEERLQRQQASLEHRRREINEETDET